MRMLLPVVAAGLVLWPCALAAQVRGIDARPSCPECTITLERELSIQGDRVAGEPLSIVRTSRGHFHISFFPTGDQVLEFDASGAFVRVLAVTGQGPREVTSARALHLAAGDTLIIFDGNRILTFDENGNFIDTRTQGRPGVNRVVRLQGQRYVINAAAWMRDLPAPQPLHILDAGRLTASFGAEPGLPASPVTPWLDLHALTADAGGSRVWSAPLTAYRIHEWSATGAAVRTWSRDPEWFTPWTELRPLSPDTRPDPRLADIRWMGGGRVMVLLHVPQSDWADHLGEPITTQDGSRRYPHPDIAGIFDTRIEVLDLDADRVVASATHPASLATFIDPERIAAYRTDEMGNPFIDVWRVRFREPGSRLHNEAGGTTAGGNAR